MTSLQDFADDIDTVISDEMIDAFNRAYSAVWEASAPVTTQGEVVTVERSALRAGLGAALAETRLTTDETAALTRAARAWVDAGNDRGSTPLAAALHKLASGARRTP